MFNFDKRSLYIVLGIIVLWNLAGYINNPNSLLSLVLSLPAVIIAMTFHEFAHAFAADKLGDDTPRREGRLTLNPLKHIEPVGFIMLVFAKFGWGRPVQINPSRFKKNISVSKGEAIVSFAGPLMNFLLAIIFTIITCITLKTTNSSIVFIGNQMGLMVTDQTIKIVLQILISIITINLGLGLFNLIPLPPLDGSKIIMPFLPLKAKQFFINNEQIFYIIFVVIWITGLAGVIISPILDVVGTGILKLGLSAFGLPIINY